jgi:hypothetical protein
LAITDLAHPKDDYALDTDLGVVVILIHCRELCGLIEYGPQKRGRVVGRLAILKGEDNAAIVAVCMRNVGLVSHTAKMPFDPHLRLSRGRRAWCNLGAVTGDLMDKHPPDTLQNVAQQRPESLPLLGVTIQGFSI